MNDENMWNNFIKTFSDFLENIVKDMNNLRTDLDNKTLSIEDNIQNNIQDNIQNNIQNNIQDNIQNNIQNNIHNTQSLISTKNKQNIILIISIQKILFKLSSDAISKYDRYFLIKKTLFLIKKLMNNDNTIFLDNNFTIDLDSKASDAIHLLQIFDNLIDKIIKQDQTIDQHI
tara:strand:+ start:407 stop:925 length:519 start_codon:yes stop_codon:yes gene_type:complete